MKKVNKMIIPEGLHKSKRIAIGFLCGAILLGSMSIIQKIIAGYNPLLPKGYIIPVLFGGGSGSVIGYYLSKIQTLNELLQQRVQCLESILPICSECNKIRKPGTDSKDPNSWQHLESYITDRTNSQFTHGICPDCIKKFYVKKSSIKPNII